jgi:hypothetical protein
MEVADMESLISDARAWRQQQAKERMGMVEEERRRYILESEVREKRLEELSKLSRRREYEKAMVDQQQDEISKTLEEEKTMQQVGPSERAFSSERAPSCERAPCPRSLDVANSSFALASLA